MQLRVKSSVGSRTITVDDGISARDFVRLLDTLDDLKTDVQSKVNIVRTGFPPRKLDLHSGDLIEKGVRSGDTIVLEHAMRTPAPESSVPSVFIPHLNHYLILRNVADDNSCLFNAVNYAINGFKSPVSPQELRTVVVNHISNHTDEYSEEILGKVPEEYCTWISKPTSWGGAIELGILAAWLDVCIVCLDVESGRFIKFQDEEKKPRRFIVLVYSGIHYDLLVLNTKVTTSSSDKLLDYTCWSVEDQELILDAAQELCGLLQSKNFATNTTTFRVRCLDCYEVLVGEMGATKHANEKNHYRFGEVK